MRRQAAVAAAVVAALSGCSPQHAPGVTGSPSSASLSSTSTAQQVSRSCDGVEINYQPPLSEQHIRCVLTLNPQLTVEVSSDPTWSFTLKRDGAAVQEFSEPADKIGESGVAPLLQDIDHSGSPVLLVVTDRGGTGGEPMAVWRLSPATQQFVRAGDLFGFRRFYQSAEGFFGNYAHSSAASGGVTLYRWDGDKLAVAVTLETQVADVVPLPVGQGEWVRNGNVECNVSTYDDPPGTFEKRAAAMRAAGIDPATATQQFCTQPWVATIYK